VDVSTEKHPDAVMQIDRADWAMLQSMGIGRVSAWLPKSQHTLYARVKLDGKMHSVHRLLLPESEQVDHTNGNGLDNRRSNIRAVTCRQNGQNLIHLKKSSIYPGVYWHKARGKWQAQIQIDGKHKYLGRFDVELDARQAYIDAVRGLGQTMIDEVQPEGVAV